MKKIFPSLLFALALTLLIKSPVHAASCNESTISSVSTEFSGTPAVIGNSDIVTVNGNNFGDLCIHDSSSAKTAEIHFVSPDGSVDKNITPLVTATNCAISSPNPISSFSQSQIQFKMDLSVFSDAELQKFATGGIVQVWKAVNNGGTFGSSVACGQTSDSAKFKLTRFSSQVCNYTYSDWSACSSNSTQTRSVLTTKPNDCPIGTPVISQSCVYTPPTCTSWTYSEWSACAANGQQTRAIASSSPVSCAGGTPILSQSCSYGPKITSISPSSIHYGDTVDIIGTGFGNKTVSNGGTQDGSVVKIYNSSQGQFIVSWTDTDVKVKINNSDNLGTISLVVSALFQNSNRLDSNPSQVTILGTCKADEWHCENYGSCQVNGTQTRSCTKTFECDVVDTPSPATSQSCTYTAPVCTADVWSCGSWGTCSNMGNQTRSCTKTFDCSATETPSPTTSQSCTSSPIQQPQIIPQPTQPSCSEDTWSCSDWNACAPSGVQNRNCKRTYDCPSAETAPPATSQYCQAPNNQTQQNPQSSNNNSNTSSQDNQNGLNQDFILRTTVNLICLSSATSGKMGSGTLIDSQGIILTNRHVVEGTKGCMVGFITSADDDPSYTEVADIVRVSNDEDIALVKIRNTNGKTFPAVDISHGSISSKNLGNKVVVFGYPGIGGSKVNYSDGSLSGFGSAKDGLANYFKTTAFIEHGNSGGGAYLMKDGSFAGIPSAGIKGDLASIGYVLSINKINNWLNSSGLAYNGAFKNLSSRFVAASLNFDGISLDDVRLFDTHSGNVIIYSDKTKTNVLANDPDAVQKNNRPTFVITGIENKESVAGFYHYFGTNIKADPTKNGFYTRKTEYTSPALRSGVTYYFIYRVKNKNGVLSDPVITQYWYKK